MFFLIIILLYFHMKLMSIKLIFVLFMVTRIIYKSEYAF